MIENTSSYVRPSDLPQGFLTKLEAFFKNVWHTTNLNRILIFTSKNRCLALPARQSFIHAIATESEPKARAAAADRLRRLL